MNLNTSEEWKRRAEAAETVCFLYGWSAAAGPDASDRELATHQAWTVWADLDSDDEQDAARAAWPDERIQGLADMRRTIRMETLERFREPGDDS